MRLPLVAAVVALTACKRDPERPQIEADPGAIDASPEVAIDSTSNAARALPIGEDAAMRAALALSPTMIRWRAGHAPAGSGLMPADNPPHDCGESHPDCVWRWAVFVHHHGHFETFERCEVHAHTGVVRCALAYDGAPWDIVGNALAVPADAATDTSP